MNSPPTRVRVRGPRSLLAVIPHLLGFHPDTSLVILGLSGPEGRVRLAFRYDLPDPPDPVPAGEIAAHAAAVLRREHLAHAIAIGYGPGALVTPAADVLRVVLPGDGVLVHDILRVEAGRYWSYLCADPVCCPPEGMPVPGSDHPSSVALAEAGLTARASRAAVAESIAPVTGPAAQAMATATRHAETSAAADLASTGPDAVRRLALALVQHAITTYRDGGTITDPDQLACIALDLTNLEVRDDAWARMRLEYRDAHIRLWTDLTRHAQPGYVAAPASLLAFVAWQNGDGALANLALDRAQADDPGYSMARLLRDALSHGLPPTAAVLSMTPEEVAASYQAQRHHQ